MTTSSQETMPSDCMSVAFRYRIIVLSVLACTLTFCSVDGLSQQDQKSTYLEHVQRFADNVLEHGMDRYGEVHSPLFVDGINVRTGEPMRWEQDGESWVLSNFASQQNLIRVFDSLTELTGDTRYRSAAKEATGYMFDNQSDSQGLLYWGGHQFVDLETMHNQFESRPHELKNNFPYYEFMWEVDPEATKQMLRAMWNAHVLDWSVLDLNRHGPYDTEMGLLWDHEFEQQEPFFVGRGLTFINFGTDMMHVGLSLYHLGEEEGARIWGLRLFEQYVRARHPVTGLGVYQYSQPERRDIPPAEGPLTGTQTHSGYGDRAENQFGAVYGDIALEGNVLWGNRARTIYGRSPIVTLHMAEQLADTEAGSYLKEKTLDGMRAYAKYAYVPEENYFRPMWTDGTDLSDDVMPRTGYYGKKGDSFQPMIPEGIMALSYARAYRVSENDPVLWEVTRNIFKANGLGDPGSDGNSGAELNFDTENTDPDMLIAVLELQRATGSDEFLRLAERIGDNILEKNFHRGYFMPTPDHIYARFDELTPLALLTLDATRRGIPESVPPYLASVGSTQGEHDEYGRIRDWFLFDETH